MDKDLSMAMEPGQDVNKLSMFQSVEVYMEKLTQLSLRILRSERGLFATTLPLSIASPSFNDMYGAASSLIILINQYTDMNAVSISSFDPKPLDLSKFDTNDANIFFGMANTSMAEPGQDCIAKLVGPDPGVVFLILACHQRLLSVFERICSSVHQELQDSQLSSLEHFLRQHDLPAAAQSSTVSMTGQAVMAVQLVSHLLGRLDRALCALSQYNTQPLGLLTAMRDGSGDTSASNSDKVSSPVDHMLECSEIGSSSHEVQQCQGYNIARQALEMVHSRHAQLHDHINTIKQTIEKSGDV
jgi:hypothetical protein